MPSRYLAVRAACALMFAIIAVASCSGSTSGVSCASIDPCPKDPPPSQHDISDCEDFLKNCPEYEAYIKCVTANTQCTSAGTTNYFYDGIDINCANLSTWVESCARTPVEAGAVLCGAPGKPCCAISTATDTECSEGCCDPTSGCVAEGALCGSTGGPPVVCYGNGCVSCGSQGGPCCPGMLCPDSTTSYPLTCDSTGACVPCGSRNEPCCAGNVCNGYTCASGTCG